MPKSCVQISACVLVWGTFGLQEERVGLGGGISRCFRAEELLHVQWAFHGFASGWQVILQTPMSGVNGEI